MDSSRNAARTLRFPMRSAHSFVSGCGSSASSPDGEEPVASGGAFEKVEKSSQAAVPEPEEAPDIFPLEGTLKRLFSAPFILVRRSRTPPRPRPGAGARVTP